MNGLSRFEENLNSVNMLNEKNRLNSTGNYVRQMYKFFRFVENLNSTNTLNVYNFTDSTRNCVHMM